VEVRFYATLRPLVGGRSVAVPDGCGTVGEALDAVIARFPDLRERLLDDAGAVRPFVAVMVNGRDIRHLQALDTPLPAGAELDVFPPVAGG
jgi:molybdopterin synthase sulfur carrier subunit